MNDIMTYERGGHIFFDDNSNVFSVTIGNFIFYFYIFFGIYFSIKLNKFVMKKNTSQLIELKWHWCLKAYQFLFLFTSIYIFSPFSMILEILFWIWSFFQNQFIFQKRGRNKGGHSNNKWHFFGYIDPPSPRPNMSFGDKSSFTPTPRMTWKFHIFKVHHLFWNLSSSFQKLP